MTAKQPLTRVRGAPALVVTDELGTVVGLNAPARRLMGDGVDRGCWEVVGELPGAEGLPCAPGCVRALVRGGLGEARHTPISLHGRRYRLSCIPVRDAAVCMMSAVGGEAAGRWEAPTAREIEVLRLVAEGATTAEVAAQLGIAPATARTHVENMRTKLGAPTRASLVALGFRLGFLE